MSSQANATKALDVHFGGFSDKGVKPENQDAFAAFQPDLATRKLKGAVVCIADGVSCSDNAQQASQTAVTTFINDYFSTPEPWSVKESVAKVISPLNSWLFHHGQQASHKQNGLVTTFSGVVFKSNTAHIFHIGDSRVYLLRDGKLRQLTKDHTHFNKDNSHYLIRALGMDSHLEVDFVQQELKVGDKFILTTDGVHDTLSQKQLIAGLHNSELSLEKQATELCLQAEELGSEDNLSCFIAEVATLPEQDAVEVHQQLTSLKIPPVLAEGNKIDNFVIEKVLHSGSRSHVYLAQEQTS